MAKITLKGIDEIALKLSKLEGQSTEIAKKAIYVGAGIVADQIRKNLEKNLAGSKYSQGDLLDSLGITSPKIDSEGNINSKVGFDSYDSKGVANQLKARVMESGSSKQKKKPFVRPAIPQVRNKAKEEMARVVDEEIKKLGL